MTALARDALGVADRVVLGALEGALLQAREGGERRPALEVLAGALAELGVRPWPASRSARVLREDREAWLRRLASAQRSDAAIAAYRYAIDDMLAWADRHGRDGGLFEECAIVDYLDDYRTRCHPAPATYHRRFLLLRRFMRWVARRDGLPDPFAELQAPPKPHQEGDWLTPAEFAALLDAAGRPPRARPGLATRDRLVLLGLVTTGVRRSELIAVDWRDVTLDGEHPSLLVRCGKGGKPRRQPLAPAFARELSAWRALRQPEPRDPVFCGLAGGRLQPTILANIVTRCAKRAGLSKRDRAHPAAIAATWLRQATGDARLVAEYLGHSDLSTVSRYTHVASDELRAAAQALGDRAAPARTAA
jgi:integrase/recombinase XerC